MKKRGLVAIAVNEAGYHEAFEAAKGMKEDKSILVNFLQCFRSQGLGE